MKAIIKKYWFFDIVLLINLITLTFYPQIGKDALAFSGKTFINFLFILTPIFICIGLLDVWIEKETMIKVMGKESGIKGILVAFCLGIVTAVPLYALLPVAAILLKKGSRISNVLIFLCTSAGIRIPLLLFEVSSLGFRFTFTQFALNIVLILMISFIIEKILTESDKKYIYENAEKL